jgi:hypothetical protein
MRLGIRARRGTVIGTALGTTLGAFLAASPAVTHAFSFDTERTVELRARVYSEMALATQYSQPQTKPSRVPFQLTFDYRVPKGPIFFDEIVCGIEVTLLDAAGNERARSDIDPHSINLNPNRVPLSYATTLYVLGGTTVRVRVRGNYE